MKILNREDFKLKPGYKYYFYEDIKYLIEICLEPCLNGFDVGLYHAEFGGVKNKNVIFYPSLIREKKCTNEEPENSPSVVNEIFGINQERNKKTWDDALEIANKFYQSYINEYKLKELKILPRIDKDFTFFMKQ